MHNSLMSFTLRAFVQKYKPIEKLNFMNGKLKVYEAPAESIEIYSKSIKDVPFAFGS